MPPPKPTVTPVAVEVTPLQAITPVPASEASKTTEALREVVLHMKQQNSYQVEQLLKTDESLRLSAKMIKGIGVLALLAFILLVLVSFQQWKIASIITEQRTAFERSKALETAVNQKLTDSSANVVRKVEQLEQRSPKVVTDYKGDLSLSVPVQPPPVGAVTVRPPRAKARRPAVPPSPTAPPAPPPTAAAGAPAAAPAPAATDYVLVPLNRP